MIKRASKKYINNLINNNSHWNILDIGCGYTAHEKANTVCDTQDLSSFYKEKNFIRLNSKNLPFKDKEFDFVISSHVMEHVEDLQFFISELERVSKMGYIEVPTKLEDNLVFENKKDHLWHMEFDDDNLKLIISKALSIAKRASPVSIIVWSYTACLTALSDAIAILFKRPDTDKFKSPALIGLVILSPGIFATLRLILLNQPGF